MEEEGPIYSHRRIWAMAVLEELSGAIIVVVSLLALGVLAQGWVRGSMW